MTQTTQDAKVAVRGGKFLTFFLDREEFGIEILKVHEIFGMMPVTHVPRTAKYILGVINLRGKIIPIIDLRLKLAMEAAPRTEETCVIVVHANGMEVGVMVDKVSEVVDIAAKDVEDTPAFAAGVDTEYILGIGKTQSKVKLLLDIDKALSKKDMQELGSAHAAHAASETDATKGEGN
jgi:purine-binding chemotaxis protein CheW